MKRFSILLLVVILSFSVLSVCGYASIATDEPTAFNIFNLLDGVGGFFRSLITNIANFTNNVISSIKDGINALITAFQKIGKSIADAVSIAIQKVIKAITDAFSFLINALKRLFIPSKESFSKFRSEILDAFNNKTGSLFSSFNYLKNRLAGLKSNRDIKESFKIVFPKGSFFYGMSVNFLSDTLTMYDFVRAIVTGFVGITTAFICYHRVKDMFKT